MESEIYFTLNQKLVPKNNMSYLKMDLAIRDGQLLQNDMIGRALSFVGHHVKEEIHIHDALFKLYYYKNWLVLSNLRVNNSVSNFEIFGTYYQPDSALNVNMQISLTDLFFRSGQKRKIQTDEGIINLDRDLDLYVNLNGNLNHQLFKVRNRKKHQVALKEQVKFINLIEADIRAQERDFYQQYVLTKGTSELTSSLINKLNDLED